MQSDHDDRDPQADSPDVQPRAAEPRPNGAQQQRGPQNGRDPQNGREQPNGKRRRRRGRRRGGRGGAPQQPQHGNAAGAPAPYDPDTFGNTGGPRPTPAEPFAEPQSTGREETVPVEGVLDLHDRGHGWLRPSNWLIGSPQDPEVHRGLVDRFHLRAGVLVVGVALVRGGKKVLHRIDTIEGEPPEKFMHRVHFSRLTSIDPIERLKLDFDDKEMVTRVLDVISPIGKGQRGLIVSPPKAGKTIMLQKIAHAIAKNHPEVRLMVLLVDERPEEVTDMRRSVKGEVYASSSDRPADEHIKIAEMCLHRAQRIAEGGGDVVVLLDSITRLARAYNKETESSGRTLSGGVDSRAMERPKRLFGAARKLEEGGSVTILGTTLVDTGSRMDEVIFEEFKGTGNMEVVLNRQLAERRIFPAIDIPASGTRKEEKLFEAWEYEKVKKMRVALHPLKPVEAMERLLKAIGDTKSNAEFLQAV